MKCGCYSTRERSAEIILVINMKGFCFRILALRSGAIPGNCSIKA
jgi:hypothetical protein